MKSRISLVLGIALLTPVFVIGLVQAVETTETTTTTTKTDTTTTKNEAKLTEEQKKSLNERIQKRKAEAKVKLTAIQEKRVQTRCKNSQVALKTLSTRATSVEANRTKVHANLLGNLNKLQTKLSGQGVDTTQLAAEITALKEKIDTFNNDLGAYRETLSDIANMDCEADPSAFKASLDQARESLKKVHADAVDIRTYVKDTIKPTLQTIRSGLENAETN